MQELQIQHQTNFRFLCRTFQIEIMQVMTDRIPSTKNNQEYMKSSLLNFDFSVPFSPLRERNQGNTASFPAYPESDLIKLIISIFIK